MTLVSYHSTCVEAIGLSTLTLPKVTNSMREREAA